MARALVIVDIQNDYFPGGGNPLAGPEAAAEQARELLDAFRASGEPVMHIQRVWDAPDAPYLVRGHRASRSTRSFRRPPGEPVFQKANPNASSRRARPSAHATPASNELVVCGMMTCMCADATVRAAIDLGYRDDRGPRRVRDHGARVRRPRDLRPRRARRIPCRPRRWLCGRLGRSPTSRAPDGMEEPETYPPPPRDSSRRPGARGAPRPSRHGHEARPPVSGSGAAGPRGCDRRRERRRQAVGRADDRDDAPVARRRPRRATARGVRHVFVYRDPSDGEVRVLINPEFGERSDEIESDTEGCLSLLGGEVTVPVERHTRVVVPGLDEDGEPVEVDAGGARSARDPARDRPPRRRADHRPGVERTTARPRCKSCACRRRHARDRLPGDIGIRGRRARAGSSGRRGSTSSSWSRSPTARRGAGAGRIAAGRGGRTGARAPLVQTPAGAAEPVDADVGPSSRSARWCKPPLLGAYPLYNLHPSLLPRWRGAAPVERAMMAGDAETGAA